MKYYKLTTYILLSSLIWISCTKDETPPSITLNAPSEESSFIVDDIMTLDILFEDDKCLSHYEINLTSPDGTVLKRNNELTEKSQSVVEEFTLNFSTSGSITVLITAIDESDNVSELERVYSYTHQPTGDLLFNVKLEYQGQPLVIFDDYVYPDGKKLNFTRVSFYTSDLKLDETLVSEVDFHNLTNSHSTAELAEIGYSMLYENVPLGSYSEVSFNIGVPAELNAKDPGEFPSGHPLAKPAENWFSWKSFIFLKIEGNIDFNNDDVKEAGFALHTGSDEALRKIRIDYPIEVFSSVQREVNLTFDIYDLFNGPERIYPIEEYPQIHSLTQLDGVIELSNNLINSIDKS